jgi:hypothetical protein
MAQPQNQFTVDFLVNRPVVIKISGQYAVRATVAHHDATGFWLLGDQLPKTLLQGFAVESSDLEKPLLFVPMHGVEWLLTPATR